MSTKTTTYTVTIRPLGRSGEAMAARMRSTEEETAHDFRARAVRKLWGKGYGWHPDLPGYPNIGCVTRPGTGHERGCTVMVQRVRIDRVTVPTRWSY